MIKNGGKTSQQEPNSHPSL